MGQIIKTKQPLYLEWWFNKDLTLKEKNTIIGRYFPKKTMENITIGEVELMYQSEMGREAGVSAYFNPEGLQQVALKALSFLADLNAGGWIKGGWRW